MGVCFNRIEFPIYVIHYEELLKLLQTQLLEHGCLVHQKTPIKLIIFAMILFT